MSYLHTLLTLIWSTMLATGLKNRKWIVEKSWPNCSLFCHCLSRTFLTNQTCARWWAHADLSGLWSHRILTCRPTVNLCVYVSSLLPPHLQRPRCREPQFTMLSVLYIKGYSWMGGHYDREKIAWVCFKSNSHRKQCMCISDVGGWGVWCSTNSHR